MSDMDDHTGRDPILSSLDTLHKYRYVPGAVFSIALMSVMVYSGRVDQSHIPELIFLGCLIVCLTFNSTSGDDLLAMAGGAEGRDDHSPMRAVTDVRESGFAITKLHIAKGLIRTGYYRLIDEPRGSERGPDLVRIQRVAERPGSGA